MTTTHPTVPAAVLPGPVLPGAKPANGHAAQEESPLLERIQRVLDDYRPTLYMDGGDVEVLQIDAHGVVALKMMGACIDCPISLLTMRLGIQRLLKEHFPGVVTGVHAETSVDLSALYKRSAA